ncbi:MAG TPA: HD domain-containing protein [Anaerolineae bacterium]|nr:HD domain-containing protein [Anaerolineae bacterium]
MDLKERAISWLAEHDVDAYLVGGVVRDRLLGRPTYDLDLVVDGDGLAVARKLANHFAGAYYPLDTERLVGRAVLLDDERGELMVDVASLRGRDLATDLADRDFTINAMAAPVADPDRVIDPHGGMGDLRARTIRPVSDHSIRSDPLRALRAVRLAASLDFALAGEALSLMRRDGPAVANVSGERVRDELAKLLCRPFAARWLRLLDDLDLLTVLLPELEAARGETQPQPHHLDVLDHSLAIVATLESIVQVIGLPSGVAGDERQEAVDSAPSPSSNIEYRISGPDLDALAPFADRIRAHLGEELGHERPRLVTLKLAALLHDVGKPARKSVEESGRIRFLGHEQVSARVVADVLQRLRFSRPEVRAGETIARHHMRPLLLAGQKSVSSRAVYRFFRDTGENGVDIVLHALADQRATYAPGTHGEEWERLVSLAARMLGDYWDRRELVAPPPLISGTDLIESFDVEPGPKVGDLLEAVREAQVAGKVRTREQALDLVRKKLPPRS